VQPLSGNLAREDTELKSKFAQVEAEQKNFMTDLQFHRALESIWSALDHANRYIVQTAPYTLYKDADKRPRVGEILHQLLETMRALSRLLAPFMPDTAKELRDLLNLSAATARPQAAWGQGFLPGHTVKPAKALFPRIDSEKK